MWPFVEPNYAVAHQISLKSDDIRSWDIVMKPISKWRSSAILNFQILVLWSRGRYLNVILLLRIKFRINWTIVRWDIAKNDFQYGGRPPFWMCKILILCHVTVLKPKSAAAHQISLKSDDPRLSYSEKNIFKMTAVRHLEFSKFGILVTWPVSELILPLHTKFRVNRRYSQKTIFNMAAVRHIGFVVTSSHCIWEHYFTFLTLFQIFKSIGLALSDILGLSCFIILAWNFWGQNLTFWG